MSIDLAIEITGTVLSLIYLFLLMKENIWCWFFSILSAIFFIYSFIDVKLYSEAILYSFFILFSIYGWYKWSTNKAGKTLVISKLPLKIHGFWIIIGFILAFGNRMALFYSRLRNLCRFVYYLFCNVSSRSLELATKIPSSKWLIGNHANAFPIF